MWYFHEYYVLRLSGLWFGVTPKENAKTTCVKVFDYVPQNMITLQSSIVKLIGGREDIHMNSKKTWGKWLRLRFGFANHLVLIVCLMS